MDPILTSKGVGAQHKCEFSQPITRVDFQFDLIGQSEQPTTISRGLTFDAPVTAMNFPVVQLQSGALPAELPLGSYFGVVTVSAANSVHGIELDPKTRSPGLYMQVVENLSAQQNALDTNRKLWASHDLSDYVFEFERWTAFFEPTPVTASVVDGVVANVASLATGEPVDTPAFLDTVGRLFEFIQEIIDERPLSLEVDYDPELGYPSFVMVDAQEGVDDEFWFSVENLAADPDIRPQRPLIRQPPRSAPRQLALFVPLLRRRPPAQITSSSIRSAYSAHCASIFTQLVLTVHPHIDEAYLLFLIG